MSSVERVLGYDPDELVGQVAFDQIHDDDRDRAIETFTAAVANPDSRPSTEYRYRHADGEWRVLRSWGKNRLDDPDIGGFVVITLDVTERKEYERDLERHQAMLETVADGVYALDEDLRVTTVNEAALELTGYSREEVLGSHISRFLDDANKAKADQMREAVVASGQAGATLELSIRRTDGSSFPAEVRFRLFDPDAPEYTGSAGVIRDITDRMDALIEDTLTLARQGRTVEESEPVDLATLVDSAWATVAPDGDLQAEIDDVTVLADPSRLQRVFENLFRNADEHGHTTSDEGTGFGLSIVRSIVEAHGWAITVTESAAGGTRFEITGVDPG